MFKTQTRKGLSLAAIVALGATLLVGSPAQAAGEVTLETASGTTYAALAGTTFELNTNVGSLVPSSAYGQLKIKVTNTGASTYSAQMVMTAGAATSGGDVSNTTSGTILKVTNQSSTNSSAVITVSTSNSVSAAVLTVQAWLDADFDDVIDSGEFVSEARVITFLKSTDVNWTTTLTAPGLAFGNSTLSAVVTSTQGINMPQAGGSSVKVGFGTISGGTYTAVAGTTVSTAGVFTDGTTATSVTGATTTAKAEVGAISISAGVTYVAVAIVEGIEAGAEVYSIVGAATVANIDAPALTDDANSNTSNQVRAGTNTSVEFTAAVSKSAGVKAAAGTPVTVTVTEGTLTSVSAVVGGGKTLSNASSTTSEKITFVVNVDADGEVTVPLTATLKADQTFTVQLSADNVVSSVATVTARDTAIVASPNTLIDLNAYASGATIKVVSGASATLTWAALDNFGTALAGDYRVYLTGGVTASAAVSAGQAAFVVSPTATTTYTAQLQKFNTSTLVYDTVGSSDTHVVTVGASEAAANITVVASSASNLALNGSALKAVDTRLGATAPTLTSGVVATINGQVTTALGIATYGVVTLSAPNVMFKVGDVYTLGSATVQTSATGAYAGVVVYSNTAGAVTLSAVVGAASKDLGLSFAAAAETTGAKWVITAPANVLPGSTAQFKAQLLDTYSNPVKVTTATTKIQIAYTGPGFITATLPSTTDADGMLSFSVLFGSADTGSIALSFTYDGDSVATTTNVVSSVVATVGAAPVVAVNQKLTVGSFKGFVAIYTLGYGDSKLSAKVAGKWLTVNNLSNFTRTVRLTGAGYDIKVDLYIDGVFVKTENITTK
jgi:hypothetical protein